MDFGQFEHNLKVLSESLINCVKTDGAKEESFRNCYGDNYGKVNYQIRNLLLK